MVKSSRKVVIIGSGPSGYTAALYLSRARLNPLLFAGEQSGGQLMLTTEVENFPGFKKGVQGPELMLKMREQAIKFGTEVADEDVTQVDFSKESKTMIAGGRKYQAETVIIATGAKAKMLGMGEEKLLGRGVSTCAVCDAAFFKDKETFVVGGGDAAMEEVLALTKFAKKVTLVHRRKTLRASQIMQKRVLTDNQDKVAVLWNSKVVGVEGGQKLEAVWVEDVAAKKKQRLSADGLFLAIGHVPETEIFQGQIDLDEKGYIITGLNSRTAGQKDVWLAGYPTMTSVEGVFAAGDVADFRYRQAVTAAGFGCMAALDVEKFLTGGSQSW